MLPSMRQPTNIKPARADSRKVIALVMSLFFSFGFCTVLVDTLIPKLKALFSLSYTEVMLTQFCFFGAYFIVSLPASRLVSRLGYFESVTLGLGIMAAGCLSFTPAAQHGSYPAFLAALFVLAAGVTVVQVAVNPLATLVGDPMKAHSRLTLAQAFNSLATAVGPLFGAAFILSGALVTPNAETLSASALAALRQSEGSVIQLPFLMIGAVLCLLAIVCWLCRHWAPRTQNSESAGGFKGLLTHSRLVFGAVAIFLYVGAEVSIGSAMVSYLVQKSVLGVTPKAAGSLVAVYWGLAMAGRFLGAGLLNRIKPGLMLCVFAIGAATLASVSSLSLGLAAAVTLLAVGFCNSIMFPTIFSLAIEGLTDEVPQASGLLCLSIVGGAIIPVMMGAVADFSGLRIALWVPVLCYIGIASYGIFCYKRIANPRGEAAPVPAMSI
ncbi:MAG TPA: sugar MFS transporter [Burkholderiaceae bacterium]